MTPSRPSLRPCVSAQRSWGWWRDRRARRQAATLYTAPARARRSMRTRFVYENAHEAHIMAVAEANYYRASGLKLIGLRRELDAYVKGWRCGQVAAVMLMEGADPVETPSQLGAWTDRGVRIIGPAWGRTRYSGGTRAPGGLTALGV